MNDKGMISGNDAVRLLTDAGYDAFIGDDGVVMIYIDFEKYLKEKDSKKYAKLMSSIGYTGSWGLKPIWAKNE